MRKVLFILTIAALSLGLSSCDNSRTKIEEAVNGFLTSYFQMDYPTTYTFCTKELSEILEMTIADREITDEQLMNKITEASKQTTFKITKIDNESLPDEAYVEYEIYSPSAQRPITKKLTLSKVEKQWLISGM
ncbi:MAG: hypothetical protein PHD11_02980 [Bacteroidales bacterium]|jgi:hypothetical protein|nr:hypothetical protein [Bacteroidales bacterium]MDD4669440.1 hypothetical protein [Bacteroidales bacterium]